MFEIEQKDLTRFDKSLSLDFFNGIITGYSQVEELHPHEVQELKQGFHRIVKSEPNGFTTSLEELYGENNELLQVLIERYGQPKIFANF